MKHMKTLALALALAGTAWIPACGSSSTETPAPSATADGFRGVLVAADGTDGVFELRPVSSTTTQALRPLSTQPIALRGTVTLGNGLTAQLTGSYDPATQSLTAQGTVQTGIGAIAFTARFENGQLSGTWTGPGGLSGSLSGLGISLGPIALYCGPFVGARQGRVTLAVSGSLAGGAAVFAGNQALLLTGSASGSALDLSFANGGRATGTVAGANVSGNWSDAAGNGTFSASSSNCPVLGSPVTPPQDAGFDATTDAGTEGGPGQDGGTGVDGGTDGGSSEGGSGDGGTVTAAQLLMEAETINEAVVAGDYIAYTFGFSKAISFIKSDGTGKDKTDDVCATFCTALATQGQSVIFLDSLNVKRVTFPNKVVTTLGTVPEAMLYARANDRYVWFSSQTQGGFYRFDTQQQNSASNLGRALSNFDLLGEDLYFTDTSNNAYVFRKFGGDFQAEPTNMQLRTNILPDTVAGGVAAHAAGSVFLTSEQPNNGVTIRIFESQSMTNAVITTIPKVATIPMAVVSVTEVRMDDNNVFVMENALGQTQQGRVLYVAKSTRNGNGATELAAYNSKVRTLALSGNAVYVGLQDGRLWRQPKP